jgi:hypothetical protein
MLLASLQPIAASNIVDSALRPFGHHSRAVLRSIALRFAIEAATQHLSSEKRLQKSNTCAKISLNPLTNKMIASTIKTQTIF